MNLRSWNLHYGENYGGEDITWIEDATGNIVYGGWGHLSFAEIVGDGTDVGWLRGDVGPHVR